MPHPGAHLSPPSLIHGCRLHAPSGTFVGLIGYCCASCAAKTKGWLLPFPAQRRIWYFRYCRLLVNVPTHPAGVLQRKFTAEKAAGCLTLERRMAYEAAIKAAVHQERAFGYQLKRILSSPFSGNPDAFYFPTRHYGAFVISLFSIIFTAVQTTNFFYDLKLQLEALDAGATGAIYSMITQLQSSFLSVTEKDLPKVASDFLFANADMLHYYLSSFANAVYYSCFVGQAVALFFYLLAWVINCLDMRVQILQARRGIWQFNPSKIAFKTSLAYVGTQISNGILTYILICFVVALIALTLAIVLIFGILTFVLTEYLTAVLIIFVPVVVNVILNMVAYKVMLAGPRTIRSRFLFMGWDMVQILLTVVTGVSKSITRFALVTVAVLFSLPRIDRSPFPAWLETYFLLDTGSKSYQAVIVMYHHHNNPVMRVFVWLVSEVVAARAEHVAAKRGPCGSRWVYVGITRPPTGRELDPQANRALMSGLKAIDRLGTHWAAIGSQKPTSGEAISASSALKDKLVRNQLEVTQEEIQRIPLTPAGSSAVTHANYIEVKDLAVEGGDAYFRPLQVFDEGEFEQDYAHGSVVGFGGEAIKFLGDQPSAEASHIRQDDFICVATGRGSEYYRPLNSWDGGYVTKSKRRISNRFWKLWMLHKNPELVIYSSRGKPKVEGAAAQKAMKKMIQAETKKLMNDAKRSVGEHAARVTSGVVHADVVLEMASSPEPPSPRLDAVDSTSPQKHSLTTLKGHETTTGRVVISPI